MKFFHTMLVNEITAVSYQKTDCRNKPDTKNGIRYEKSTGDQKTTYYTDGGRIIAEDRNGTWLQYYYDSMGLMGLRYNGTDYLYVKDALGNIIEIIDSSGTVMAS